MKKILLIFTILLILSCATSQSVFESIEKKSYIGKVVEVKHMRQGWGINSTYIITDMDESLFTWGIVKVKVGTECYVYANKNGTKIYMIWDGAKESYEIE